METREIDNFRANLHIALEVDGRSMNRLATDLGMGQPYLSRIRSGTTHTGYSKPVSPGLDNCEKIATGLGYLLREMLLPPDEFTVLAERKKIQDQRKAKRERKLQKS